MLLWAVAHAAVPLVLELGRNPPWNQPHVTFLALRRSPTFFPDMVTSVFAVRVQSSRAAEGRASPINEPESTTPLGLPEVIVAPAVWPEIRLMTPGAEGPNV